MSIELITAMISVGIAAFSLIVSFLTYWWNRRSVQLKIAQESQMIILASRVAVLWDQINSIISSKVHQYHVDPYIFESMRKNAFRLEEALEKGIGLDLWNILVEKRTYSLVLYSAFIQSLLYAASRQEYNPDDWTHMHLVMGMIRLIDICQRYKSDAVSKITNEIKIHRDLIEKAWVYLEDKSKE